LSSHSHANDKSVEPFSPVQKSAIGQAVSLDVHRAASFELALQTIEKAKNRENFDFPVAYIQAVNEFHPSEDSKLGRDRPYASQIQSAISLGKLV
jgi:hypothetical protein